MVCNADLVILVDALDHAEMDESQHVVAGALNDRLTQLLYYMKGLVITYYVTG